MVAMVDQYITNCFKLGSEEAYYNTVK